MREPPWSVRTVNPTGKAVAVEALRRLRRDMRRHRSCKVGSNCPDSSRRRAYRCCSSNRLTKATSKQQPAVRESVSSCGILSSTGFPTGNLRTYRRTTTEPRLISSDRANRLFVGGGLVAERCLPSGREGEKCDGGRENMPMHKTRQAENQPNRLRQKTFSKLSAWLVVNAP